MVFSVWTLEDRWFTGDPTSLARDNIKAVKVLPIAHLSEMYFEQYFTILWQFTLLKTDTNEVMKDLHGMLDAKKHVEEKGNFGENCDTSATNGMEGPVDRRALGFLSCLSFLVHGYRWGTVPVEEDERTRQVQIPNTIWSPFTQV